MKFGLFLLGLCVILPIVNAESGRTFELDFNVREDYNLWMEKSDRVLFEYGGFNHTIILDDIKGERVEMDVFLFLEEELHTPYYLVLSDEYRNRLDFDRDGEKELEINWIDMEEDRANIIFTKLEAWDSDAIIEPRVKREIKTDSNLLIPGIILGIFILILVYVIALRKKEGYY